MKLPTISADFSSGVNIWLLGGTFTLFWSYKAYTWNKANSDWRWAPAAFILFISCFLFWYDARDYRAGGAFSPPAGQGRAFFAAVTAIVAFKYANTHYLSSWRIPVFKSSRQCLSAAILVAIGAYLFIGVAYCFVAKTFDWREAGNFLLADNGAGRPWFPGDAILLFSSLSGLTAFAIGTLFTLYWARLIFPKGMDRPIHAEKSTE
jgi:hypothetical protein